MVMFIPALLSPLHKIACVCTTEIISGKEITLIICPPDSAMQPLASVI